MHRKFSLLSRYNYTGGPNSNTNVQKKSFIFQHQTEKHQGQPENFKRKVLRSYKDCLSRQASEGIFISKIQGEILNSKSEFHQPAIVTIRREVSRGLWHSNFGLKAIQFLRSNLHSSYPFLSNNLVTQTQFKAVILRNQFMQYKGI